MVTMLAYDYEFCICVYVLANNKQITINICKYNIPTIIYYDYQTMAVIVRVKIVILKQLNLTSGIHT